MGTQVTITGVSLIQPGDRVAVLGRGIAVVEQVEGNWIRAVLWNRDRLRIRRNEITWHDGNMRWETSRDTCAVASGKA